MKKLSILLALIATFACLNTAEAKDNIFGGVEVEDAYTTKAPASLPTEVKAPAPTKVADFDTSKEEAATLQSLNGSLKSIESAEVELRKKLTTSQQEFAEIDKNYKTVKYERKQLKKVVKKTKSRIKALEKSKKAIAKALNSTISK